jgi:uncharacterized protein YegL
VNNNLTDITILLDRSGSMQSQRDNTIKGVNLFLKEQSHGEGRANLTLIQVDDQYDVHVHAVDIAQVQPLTRMTYVPRGDTALYDAMARAIDDTGTRLARMPEAKRPAHVLFVVMTDGEENASINYSRWSGGCERVFAKVTKQRDVFNWTFVYLGANQDGIGVGTSLGFAAGMSATYGVNEQSIGQTFTLMTNKTSSLRSAGVYTSYSEDERVAMDTPSGGVTNNVNVTTS